MILSPRHAEDVGQIRLGRFLAPADGRPTWAEVHGCEGSEASERIERRDTS